MLVRLYQTYRIISRDQVGGSPGTIFGGRDGTVLGESLPCGIVFDTPKLSPITLMIILKFKMK